MLSKHRKLEEVEGTLVPAGTVPSGKLVCVNQQYHPERLHPQWGHYRVSG